MLIIKVIKCRHMQLLGLWLDFIQQGLLDIRRFAMFEYTYTQKSTMDCLDYEWNLILFNTIDNTINK